MKKILITFLLIYGGSAANAQGIGEWFNQKNTQKKYLLEQIAALKAYTAVLNKGYNVVKDGSNLISDIRKGELNLHSSHFDSLKKVNPRIRYYGSADKILSLQAQMATARNTMQSQAKKSGQFTGQELENLKRICTGLSESSAKDLEELELVISDGRLQLSDDQRIARIEKLYAATKEQQVYQNRLNSNLLSLAAVRSQENKDNKMLRELYGIH
jgi:cob(I)alamin adenosyltransferase